MNKLIKNCDGKTGVFTGEKRFTGVFEKLRHPLRIMSWEGYLGSQRQRSRQLNALSAGLNIRQEKNQAVLKPSLWWQTFK